MNAISSSCSFPSMVTDVTLRRRSLPPSATPSSISNSFLTISNSSTCKEGKPPTEAAPSAPPPRRRPRAAARTSPQVMLCNALDDFIDKYMDPIGSRPSVDPRRVLAGNHAPVDELPPTPTHAVLGTIPRCIAGGAYIRNGPNPQHQPRGPHHFFDGDGMLHSLLLPDEAGAAATLCSRYVRTQKYLLERDAGAPLLQGYLGAFYGAAGVARAAVFAMRVLTGQINLADGIGLANTSLALIGDRLYALGETDLPYAVSVSPEDGEITTLGRCDFDGRLHKRMTAHPKKDPVTGELFAFRCDLVEPILTYFRFDADGNKSSPEVPIYPKWQVSLAHDFAVTERYAVFLDTQISIAPMNMLLRGGALIESDDGKVSRVGVLPRYATTEAEMQWFEVPGFSPLHVLNAWEEDDELVLVAPNVLSPKHILDRAELVHSCLEMVRIDLRAGGGVVSRRPLTAASVELGTMHPGYMGRKNRYAYLGVVHPVLPKMTGVVKIDLELAGKDDCVVARRDYGLGCFGGEPFFVAKGERKAAEEDEGYLVTYVHDEGKEESRFVVMDAQSTGLDVVAEVLLPRRVPYGFHGLFVTQQELRSQRHG